MQIQNNNINFTGVSLNGRYNSKETKQISDFLKDKPSMRLVNYLEKKYNMDIKITQPNDKKTLGITFWKRCWGEILPFSKCGNKTYSIKTFGKNEAKIKKDMPEQLLLEAKKTEELVNGPMASFYGLV